MCCLFCMNNAVYSASIGGSDLISSGHVMLFEPVKHT